MSRGPLTLPLSRAGERETEAPSPLRGEGRGEGAADLYEARSLKRWIFPVAVLGSSGTNSIQRGYL